MELPFPINMTRRGGDRVRRLARDYQQPEQGTFRREGGRVEYGDYHETTSNRTGELSEGTWRARSHRGGACTSDSTELPHLVPQNTHTRVRPWAT
jgi:hypothetical protein